MWGKMGGEEGRGREEKNTGKYTAKSEKIVPKSEDAPANLNN